MTSPIEVRISLFSHFVILMMANQLEGIPVLILMSTVFIVKNQCYWRTLESLSCNLSANNKVSSTQL